MPPFVFRENKITFLNRKVTIPARFCFVSRNIPQAVRRFRYMRPKTTPKIKITTLNITHIHIYFCGLDSFLAGVSTGMFVGFKLGGFCAA